MPSEKPKKKKVVIALSDDYMKKENFGKTFIKAAEEAGLEKARCLETIGMVLGILPEDSIKDLEKLEGVESVEIDHRVHTMYSK